jgi:hypothetical protein
VARTEFHEAKKCDPLARDPPIDLGANRAIGHAKRLFAAGELEGQRQRLQFGNRSSEESHAHPGHLDGACTHTLNVFLRAAQLHGGKEIHHKLSSGCLLKLLLEELHGLGRGVLHGKIARRAPLGLRHGGGLREADRDSCNERSDEFGVTQGHG